MSNLRACAVAWMLALAACGGGGGGNADAAIDQQTIDAKVYMDAPPPTFDWSCEANKTPPTSPVASTATLSGAVLAVTIAGGGGIAPLQGAAVKACVNGAANCTGGNTDGNDTSDAQGAWTIGPITTGGTPVDDYLQMTMTGYRTTYAYPDSPFLGDQANIPMLTFDDTAAGALGFLGCDASQAIVGLALVDCALQPITDSGNVMITLEQGGTVVTGTGVLDASQFNAMAAGTFLVCAVPGSSTGVATEVSATYLTHTFAAHTVKAVTGETTSTLLVPGY
jgi:hypothetical protein